MLYQDDDLRITQYLPTFAVPGMLVKARTEIHKTSHMPFVCSFSCKVDADGMIPGETELRADNVSQEYGETMVLEQTFRPEEYIFGNGDVSVRFSGITVQKSGVKEAAPDTSMALTPVYGTALEYVHKTSYRGNLDVDLDRKYDEKLWIAGIQLIRSDRHSIIDRVERAPFDQYVYSSEQLMISGKAGRISDSPGRTRAGRPHVSVQGSSERSAVRGAGTAQQFQRRVRDVSGIRRRSGKGLFFR